MNIQLTSIIVDNPAEAFYFYTQTLGFLERMFVEEAHLAIVVSPEDPHGTGLMLEPDNNPVSKVYKAALYQQQIPVIVFGVADIQAEYTRLKDLGVEFIKPPTKTDWGMEAVFDDTCGNYVQIAQAA